LKSVALSATRMPFERRHSVMPASSAADETTRPGAGSGSSSGFASGMST